MMKERLIQIFQFTWKAGSFCLFWWLVYVVGHETYKYFAGPSEKEKQEEQEYNPRTWLPNTSFEFKDSLYFVTVRIDSVQYNPPEPEMDTRDR